MESEKKIGLFFGAGAELDYGMPTGGEFAIDIFKNSGETDRTTFKNLRNKIEKNSLYDKYWLPKDYEKRSVSMFGKRDYSQLISSTLENNKDKIIDFLNSFDDKVASVKNKDIDKEIEKIIEEKLGKTTYEDKIKLNEKLEIKIELFKSEYFSAFLQILSKNNKNTDWSVLQEIVIAFLHLLVGAAGENFVNSLNTSVFENNVESLKIFDDFYGYFSFDYKGISGLDLILNRKEEENNIIIKFALDILEKMYKEIFDYQDLINSHYPYLFKPNSDWAKFCKIAIFLHSVGCYITKKYEKAKENIKSNEGYYHDMLKLDENAKVKIIGTSNYTNLIKDITQKEEIVFLNGNVESSYDPYLNKIIEKTEIEKSKHFYVPFLFTQSGTKPLTTYKMAKDFVNLANGYKECDVVASIGFGFNDDDGHINSLFRKLIEKGKKVVIFNFLEFKKTEDLNKYYKQKLRITEMKNLEIVNITSERKVENKNWTDYLLTLI